jgi:hypothetical protein
MAVEKPPGICGNLCRQAHNLKVTGSNPVPATKASPSDARS